MTALAPTQGRTDGWTDVCPLGALVPDRGVAALVDGHQVAVFVLHDGTVHALDNRDPVSGANVLSRGLVGDRAGTPMVTSPVYKQVYDLRTGRCADDESVAVRVHLARVARGRVQIRLRGAGDGRP